MAPKPRRSRAKTPEDVKSLARSYTDSAIRTLAAIMSDADAPHASRVTAAECLLSRGWGKPVQTIEGNVTHSYVTRMPEVAPSAEEWQNQHAPTIQ